MYRILAFHAPSAEITRAYASLRKELREPNRAFNWKTGKFDLPAHEYICANSLWPAIGLGLNDEFHTQMTAGATAISRAMVAS